MRCSGGGGGVGGEIGVDFWGGVRGEKTTVTGWLGGVYEYEKMDWKERGRERVNARETDDGGRIF